ncbi:MAG TPA: hypothetical protein VF393_04355, partial [archaeon]
ALMSKTNIAYRKYAAPAISNTLGFKNAWARHERKRTWICALNADTDTDSPNTKKSADPHLENCAWIPVQLRSYRPQKNGGGVWPV